MAGDKIIAVPQAEFLDIIAQMNAYAQTSFVFLRDCLIAADYDSYDDPAGMATSLCEFYAGCVRIQEMALDVMMKHVDSKGAKIPENAIVVDDLDYVTITTMLTGLLALEQKLLEQKREREAREGKERMRKRMKWTNLLRAYREEKQRDLLAHLG